MQRLSRRRSVEARLVVRAKIILAAAEETENQQIAAELGTLRKTVGLWRKRFAEHRPAGKAKDALRDGRPARGKMKLAPEIVRVTTTEKLPHATHWGTRTLAKRLGTNPKWSDGCEKKRTSSPIV